MFCYILYKHKQVEKMTDSTTLSPIHLTAIKNLGLVASSLISPDGDELTLPYKRLIVGNAVIGSWDSDNNYAYVSHKLRRGDNYGLLFHNNGNNFINTSGSGRIYFRNNNSDQITFNQGNIDLKVKDTGINWSHSSDAASIKFIENPNDTNNTNLVFEVKDDDNDSFIFRQTHYNKGTKDLLKLSRNKHTFRTEKTYPAYMSDLSFNSTTSPHDFIKFLYDQTNNNKYASLSPTTEVSSLPTLNGTSTSSNDRDDWYAVAPGWELTIYEHGEGNGGYRIYSNSTSDWKIFQTSFLNRTSNYKLTEVP